MEGRPAGGTIKSEIFKTLIYANFERLFGTRRATASLVGYISRSGRAHPVLRA